MSASVLQRIQKFHLDKVGAIGSIATTLCCLGLGPLIALLSAVGIGFVVNDAVLLPLLFVFLILGAVGLILSYQRHRKPCSLMLHISGGILIVGFVFVLYYPLLVWIGMAAVIGAPISDFLTRKSRLLARNRSLLIIGGGSAAFSAAIRANDLGATVTLINDGLPLGGTCVNVGCIPSKALIQAAAAHYMAAHHKFAGIQSTSRVTDFSAIIRQKNELVEEQRQVKYLDILSSLPNVRLINGHGKLVARNVVEVNGERIAGDRVLIATGASPLVPSIPGLAQAGYLTSDTALELSHIPDSLIVLGGRYIALEYAQMFQRLGSKVTILQRSSQILPTESEDIARDLTSSLALEGIEVVTGVVVEEAHRSDGLLVVETKVEGERKRFSASEILIATGREPNVQEMGLESLGIDLDTRGFLKVNDTLETTLQGVYGAGDVVGEPMYVYAAAYEGALAAENAILGGKKRRDYRALPWVIFTDPQVAGIGLDYRQAAEKGIDVDTATLPVSHVPRSVVERDERGFVRLIRDRTTDKLVGARILASHGSELLMEISLAIRYGITVSELASCFHPYLTLSEAVKLAAINFTRDVKTLSCCAGP